MNGAQVRAIQRRTLQRNINICTVVTGLVCKRTGAWPKRSDLLSLQAGF